MIRKYTLIFLITLIFGSVGDVPLMFLGIEGHLSLTFLIIVAFLTDIASDLFWYWLGGKIGLERLKKMKWFIKNPERLEMAGRIIHRYGILVMIGAKFVHGLGVVVQTMSGVHRYSKKKFILGSIIGAAIILGAIYTLARIFTSISLVEKYLSNVKLALAVFVFLVIGIDFFVSKKLKKYFIREGSETEPPQRLPTH